jgi:hypothetical protein
MAVWYREAQLPSRRFWSAHPSPVTFEVLDRSLVRFGFFAGSESPKIAPLASLGIPLA